MLLEVKTIDTIAGPRTYEIREGVGRFGEPVYIIASYMGDGYNRSYHEEIFADHAEAISWYNNCI